jgi:hypothetical protein
VNLRKNPIQPQKLQPNQRNNLIELFSRYKHPWIKILSCQNNPSVPKNHSGSNFEYSGDCHLSKSVKIGNNATNESSTPSLRLTWGHQDKKNTVKRTKISITLSLILPQFK